MAVLRPYSHQYEQNRKNRLVQQHDAPPQGSICARALFVHRQNGQAGSQPWAVPHAPIEPQNSAPTAAHTSLKARRGARPTYRLPTAPGSPAPPPRVAHTRRPPPDPTRVPAKLVKIHSFLLYICMLKCKKKRRTNIQLPSKK